MDIYVGNLPYEYDERKLFELFSAYGRVQKAKLMLDMNNGRPKGIGFVTMPEKNEAEDGIKKLNESEVEGRKITVTQAQDQQK